MTVNWFEGIKFHFKYFDKHTAKTAKRNLMSVMSVLKLQKNKKATMQTE